MLHRGVTNSVVEYNYVHDQPNGVGVAVFDSDSDTVANNTLTDNAIGIRLSGGASDHTISDNVVSNTAGFLPDVRLVPQFSLRRLKASNRRSTTRRLIPQAT